MTHACVLDGICNLDEELLVLCGILAPDKDLDGKSAALHLIEIFCYPTISRGRRDRVDRRCAPFFWVVRI